ncbi:hypothetical protein M878_44760 [Streptomyces roseochromogenus subsp. oscitans DS 12.976]|uniref:Condensation domain-containing protein n=1 Tax=Streptomyces roseochromogenus subsp. oscitans DS 12.976 TaxID=1352936 RepID=V6JEU2_STRRC|nr:hypothetical protein M878_44760 [Streptomyces roseochromogenus subsp. oscitans DS 12.976]
MHHLVFDGWSETLLVDDLARAWTGEPLRPLHVTYDSYSRWDRARGARLLEAELPFWREGLRNTPTRSCRIPPQTGKSSAGRRRSAR